MEATQEPISFQFYHRCCTATVQANSRAWEVSMDAETATHSCRQMRRVGLGHGYLGGPWSPHGQNHSPLPVTTGAPHTSSCVAANRMSPWQLPPLADSFPHRFLDRLPCCLLGLPTRCCQSASSVQPWGLGLNPSSFTICHPPQCQPPPRAVTPRPTETHQGLKTSSLDAQRTLQWPLTQ